MMTMIPGTLFIIAAPSGGGKTSLIERLVKAVKNLEVSVSHTTRCKRPGEIEGFNYFFIEKAIFADMLQRNIFLEYATVYGESYGTSREWVHEKLKQGVDIILEIDWQGARQVKKIIPDCVSIFILPPTLTTLHQRLIDRGQDKAEVIEKRMLQAKDEIKHCDEFDYLIVNEDFEKTLSQLLHIIHASQLRQSKQQQRYANLIKELTNCS